MATFALGIFIASFFVSVAPRSGFTERRYRHFEEMQRLRMENDELRQENLRLKNKLIMNWDDSADIEDEFSASDGAVIHAVPPPPPPAPRMHR
jgi:hypothetical protein